MGEQDLLMKRLLRRPEIFADAINYYFFNGRQIVLPEALKPVDTTEIQISHETGNKELKQRISDARMEWTYESMADDNHRYVIFAQEAQTSIDYGMPLRICERNGLTYGNIRKELAARNEERWNSIHHTRGEWLGKVLKGDLVPSVITLILNFTDQPWDGPMSLREMISPDDPFRDIVDDVKLHVISASDIKDFSLFHSQLSLPFMYAKDRNNREGIRKLTQAEKFANVDPEMGELLCGILGVNYVPQSGGGFSMSKAIEEMVSEGRAVGRVEGRAEGRVEGRAEGRAEGREQNQLANIRNLCDSMSWTIQQAMNALKVPVEEQPRYIELLNARP